MADAVVANPYEGLGPDDRKRWVCIYPAYLNTRKTTAEGRRIPRNKAVDNPLCSEIRDVCQSQQLNAEVEQQKFYPRELARDHIHSGRVRVQLKNASGQPLNQNIKSKRELFLVVAEMIPKLKTRQSGKAPSESSSGGGGGGGASGKGGGAGGGASSKKKKGKRK